VKFVRSGEARIRRCADHHRDDESCERCIHDKTANAPPSAHFRPYRHMNQSSYGSASSDTPTVTLHIANGLATITLDSPSTRNAISARLTADLTGVLERLMQERNVRVAVIRAKGSMFCPGADLAWLQPDSPGAAERVDAVLNALNPLFVELRNAPFILVAAVHGAVAGGGLGLMNCADLVIASSNTRFNTAYTRIGATPDLGATWWLPRQMGERIAMELLLLADGMDAARAHELGLVNFVVDAERFDAEVDRLLQRLLSGPASAFSSVKKLVYRSSESSLPAQLQSERQLIVEATRGAEFGEGVRAFVEKRAPRF
jgi:2-(1,2-epoxy-1,2-dihydrophenyl)acetyl-CoA isomerase